MSKLLVEVQSHEICLCMLFKGILNCKQNNLVFLWAVFRVSKHDFKEVEINGVVVQVIFEKSQNILCLVVDQADTKVVSRKDKWKIF